MIHKAVPSSGEKKLANKMAIKCNNIHIYVCVYVLCMYVCLFACVPAALSGILRNEKCQKQENQVTSEKATVVFVVVFVSCCWFINTPACNGKL